jgi:transposase
MTKKTTRTEKYINNETVLFLAFEVGAKEWKLGFSTGLGQKARRRGIRAGDLEKLQKEITAAKKRFGLGAETAVMSCYEAGQDGLWLHRYLSQARIENVIVDSSSIEVNRRARRAKSDRLDVEKIRQLEQLRAIGRQGAWVLVREFFGWRKFKNRREVGALAGLAPTPYQSGDSQQEQGISKAGNRHVRAVAVELAWAWLRYQPHSRLTQWYRRRFEKGGPRARKVGIVAVARRLLIELWRYLETGVLPERAEL